MVISVKVQKKKKNPKPMLTAVEKDLFLRWERSSINKYLDILHALVMIYHLLNLFPNSPKQQEIIKKKPTEPTLLFQGKDLK